MANKTIDAGGTGYQDSRPPMHQYGAEFGDIDTTDEPVKHEKRTIHLFGTLHDRDLLVSKLFYFFFYSAFGSLFPLISIYFKQLGMSSLQAGILVGIRPFVEFGSIPFWSSFADKFRQGKKLLLFCVLSWLVSTYLLNYMRDVPSCCYDCKESDECRLEPTRYGSQVEEAELKEKWSDDFETTRYGVSPLAVPIDTAGAKSCIAGVEELYEGSLLRPRYSARVYKADLVNSTFVLMLLIVCIGEFLSSPAVSLADGCTLSYIKENPDHFGRQRLFGSMGWAFFMFVMGCALDSTNFPNHPCGVLEEHEKNYGVCFFMFAFLMFLALIVSAMFTFPADEAFATRPDEIAGKIIEAQELQLDQGVTMSLRQTAASATSSHFGPKFIQVLRTFSAPNHAIFLFITWWFGVGVGLIFSFLFWHLQDIGGSPFLFGIAAVVNHVSELIAYFYSFVVINKHGHLKILYVGLAANVLRFFYIAMIPNGWLVLPIEMLQGLTHATVWSAASTYISLVSPIEQKADAQHFISGLHHGVGKGLGTIMGGAMISIVGTRITFVIYAVLSAVLLVAWIALNKVFNVDHAPVAVSQQDAGGHLAPHGIPMAVPYNKSNTNLRDMPQAQNQAPAYDPTQDAYDKYVTGGR